MVIFLSAGNNLEKVTEDPPYNPRATSSVSI